jgi:hypothetical protein
LPASFNSSEILWNSFRNASGCKGCFLRDERTVATTTKFCSRNRWEIALDGKSDSYGNSQQDGNGEAHRHMVPDSK